VSAYVSGCGWVRKEGFFFFVEWAHDLALTFRPIVDCVIGMRGKKVVDAELCPKDPSSHWPPVGKENQPRYLLFGKKKKKK